MKFADKAQRIKRDLNLGQDKDVVARRYGIGATELDIVARLPDKLRSEVLEAMDDSMHPLPLWHAIFLMQRCSPRVKIVDPIQSKDREPFQLKCLEIWIRNAKRGHIISQDDWKEKVLGYPRPR